MFTPLLLALPSLPNAVTGLGAILLLAVLFAIARQVYRQRHTEWLPVVNEQGEVQGKATRCRCHSGARLLHPVVHLHITNPQGDILLQKRGKHKHLLPGKWDTAVGGHVNAGESIENALKRESLEELGISRLKARFLGCYTWEGERERELVYAFLCTAHDEIRVPTEEVEETRFWSRPDIETRANATRFTPNFLHEYALLLK
ncbi:MAG: NUDIX domain-containing protein [Odoribacteraceae bacterium]|jgi:isopentenyldiphosphate isomerase|nr:NUDIX domain-containing protein [Odoribacteraceae bacterium]